MSLQPQIDKVKEQKPLWKSNSRIIGRAAEIYSCEKFQCIKCNEMNWLECIINAKSKDQICKNCGKKYQIKCKNISEKSYNNIKKMDYPHMLITTSLSDNRVLFDEPAKFTAKLREYKTDNNLLLLKTEMNAGHGGKSGRDGAIEEIAIDYAFALKISEKI